MRPTGVSVRLPLSLPPVPPAPPSLAPYLSLKPYLPLSPSISLSLSLSLSKKKNYSLTKRGRQAAASAARRNGRHGRRGWLRPGRLLAGIPAASRS